MMAAYGSFIATAIVIAMHFSDRDFSTTLTISTGIQALGFLMLTLKVQRTKSVAGISSKSLEMFAMSIFTRLSSTLVKSGYIPVDRSGDLVYQLGDVISLILVINLLYKVHRTMAPTYQKDLDTLSLGAALPPAIILACCVHGHLNRSFFFDSLWYFSLNLETIAMLPQLWMLTNIGGEVEGMTSHFVFAIFAAKFSAWLFWYHGYPELADGYVDADDDGIPEDWGTSNHGGYMIIIMYTLQLLGSADFVFYYLKAFIARSRMVLPEATLEV